MLISSDAGGHIHSAFMNDNCPASKLFTERGLAHVTEADSPLAYYRWRQVREADMRRLQTYRERDSKPSGPHSTNSLVLDPTLYQWVSAIPSFIPRLKFSLKPV